jgi:hypothetical protein
LHEISPDLFIHHLLLLIQYEEAIKADDGYIPIELFRTNDNELATKEEYISKAY